MCRWIAYTGEPIFLDRLVTKPAHSLVEQSINANLQFKEDGSLWTTNGDGFGIGWYASKPEPGLFKDAMPAWNDQNLHELCAQTKASLFFAHVRASTQGGVQRNNSHPFKYKNWLFQHNGDVEGFSKLKRTLQNEVAEELYPLIRGNTDSETSFYLALTYGLQENPKMALEKMIDRLIRAQEEAGMKRDLSFSASITDGNNLYTIRYFTPGATVRTQFFTKDMARVVDVGGTSKESEWPSKGVVVVSEPLDRLSDYWTPVPESSFMTIRNGEIKIEDFAPQGV
ncbi:MAG: class II glutamine amidotransferase [Alphaproteobacteria bacterium]|nr:class II glutamine amidotransferase [Alphaproteobacteria bacterium]MBP7759931.1 class II glutamine amidotransferase [Alphaproteobacteria bacterium]MBP7763285.1 class II glutamine amidotransferase [Alphaproteobacteria bacterium]MBP7904893.1 class II glutamine amidotransferase [Alphaproteobacteria bacterium]